MFVLNMHESTAGLVPVHGMLPLRLHNGAEYTGDYPGSVESSMEGSEIRVLIQVLTRPDLVLGTKETVYLV